MELASQTLSWVVESVEPGDRVGRADQEVARGLGLSRALIQRLMERGLVWADGKTLGKATRLQRGQRVEVHLTPTRRLSEAGAVDEQCSQIPILFEDEHLVVVNKPAGLVVHADHVHTDSLSARLLRQVGTLSVGSDAARPGIVHRLDRMTSGVMVVAKTDLVHPRLAELFSKHDIERRYWALCYGVPKGRTGKIESMLGRNPKDRKKITVMSKGRRAITHYRVLHAYGNHASWIEARLETGRTHQVRVHLTALGCSIFGDTVYGVPTERQSKWTGLPGPVRRAVSGLSGQALHARTLGFCHPVTQENLHFEAPAPEHFLELVRALES